MKRIKRLLLLTSLSLSVLSGAQPVFFELEWGSGGDDFTRCLKQFPDGSIFVVGFSDSGVYGGFDVALSRVSDQGVVQWTKFYGDSLDQYGNFLDITYDGKLVIVGETGTPSNGLDFFVYKIDTSGNMIWSRTYGTAVNESMRHIEETFDKGFIITGFQTDGNNSNDAYLMKTDSLGNPLWERWFGGPDNDYGFTTKQLPDSGYLLSADTRSFGNGGYDVNVVRMDKLGNVIWDNYYGDSFQNGCQGIALSGTGNYISYGETEMFTFSPFENFIEFISPSGISLWRRTFGGPNADAAFSIIENSDLTFTITGYSNSILPGPLNLQVVRVDTNGTIIWARSYGGFSIDIGYEIMGSNDGGYLICGHKTDSLLYSQFYLLHLDQAGLLTGREDLSEADLCLPYPNPFSGTFYLSLPKASSVHPRCQLFDIAGRELKHTFEKSGNSMKFNILDPFSGWIFGRIFTENEVYTFKAFQSR